MNVFYHRGARPNVGDDLNALLWSRLIQNLDTLHSAQWLIGIGTILDQRLNALLGQKVVVGSGLRIGTQPRFGRDVCFAAVRGPLTAERLGLPAELAVCDPGFLAPHVFPQAKKTRSNIGFVPHVYSIERTNICAAAQHSGIRVISPELEVDEFLRQLSECSRVYCESLHGAIFADALRIPWARVRVCSHYYEGEGVSDFKWQDAFSAVGLRANAINRIGVLPSKRSWPLVNRTLRPVYSLAEQRIARWMRECADSDVFRLSTQERIEEQTTRLLGIVAKLNSREFVDELPRVSERRASGQKPTRVLMFPKDGTNPYLSQLCASLESGGAVIENFTFSRALRQRYDVLHFHWPDIHLRTHSAWRALIKHARLGLVCSLMKRRGTRIVWTLHNLRAHESDHWLSSKLFAKWFPQTCTQVIALSQHGLRAAKQLYPVLAERASSVVAHGHYADLYKATPTRAACKQRLGLHVHRFTMVFFGNIRPYKNVPELIRCFRELPDEDVSLVIAGQPYTEDYAREIEQLAQGDEQIQLHLRFVAEEEVPLLIGAADLVVLPFDSILNSGSVLLALSLQRPVLAPRLGALPEIQSEVGTQWLRLYEGPLTARALVDAKTSTNSDGLAGPNLSAFGWNAIGKATLDAYRGDAPDTREDRCSATHLPNTSVP